MERTVTGIVYLDMLQNFLIPIKDNDTQGSSIFHQQCTSSFQAYVPEFLNNQFLDWWTNCKVNGLYGDLLKIKHLMTWRKWSLKPYITPNLLHYTWEENDYQLDVCHITGGSHTEMLQSLKLSIFDYITMLCDLLYNMILNYYRPRSYKAT
jgi:hypothetical protein